MSSFWALESEGKKRLPDKVTKHVLLSNAYLPLLIQSSALFSFVCWT